MKKKKVEEVIYEDNIKNAYEKQGIDIYKILNPYKEIEDMLQEIQPIIQKRKSRDYDLER